MAKEGARGLFPEDDSIAIEVVLHNAKQLTVGEAGRAAARIMQLPGVMPHAIREFLKDRTAEEREGFLVGLEDLVDEMEGDVPG